MNRRSTPGAFVRHHGGPTIELPALRYHAGLGPFPHEDGGGGGGGAEAGTAGDGGGVAGLPASGSGDGSTAAGSGGTGTGGTGTGTGGTSSTGQGAATVATLPDGTKVSSRGQQGSGTPQQGGDQQQQGQQGGQPGGQAPPDGSTATDWSVEALPAGAQKLIADLRKEAGDNRAKASKEAKTAKDTADKLQGFIDGFAKVMGLEGSGEGQQAPPDPAELTKQIADLSHRERTQAVELAVWKAATAGERKANAGELLDSRDFLSKIHGLDPAADDFATKLGEAIDAALKSNPSRFTAATWSQQPAAPSGGQFTGGPGGRTDPNDKTVDDFVKERAPSTKRK